MSEIVALRGISKSYRSGESRLPVLEGLDLSLQRGELVAVVGESGVGKSTLLHLMGLLDRPDSGEYLFDGRDVLGGTHREHAAFRNRNVGFVFQFHNLLPEFNALENVLMPRLIRGDSRASAEADARQLLDEMLLTARAHHRPSQLSGGEQQRVAIARALVAKPGLLLADEPTGNLDPRTSVQVFGVLRRAHQDRQLTTVVATHNERLAELCDRTLLLTDRQLQSLDAEARRAYYSPGS